MSDIKDTDIHWPKIGGKGVLCSCGWTVGGVIFQQAKRLWWIHATGGGQ